MTESNKVEFARALRREAAAYDVELGDEIVAGLGQYYALLQKWNPRLHLVAPCSPAEFATRHVLESLMALPYLTSNANVADIGSGGGLPIIPCLIARPDLSAVLFEASPKKAVFLREALLQLKLNAMVLPIRFDSVIAHRAQFITCRALEKFGEMLPQIVDWAPTDARLLFFGGDAVETGLRRLRREFTSVAMPNSNARYLFIVEPDLHLC